MKSYHDITGDGGSRIAEQIAIRRDRIEKNLASVRHRVGIASGKGGVGKSTIARALASLWAAGGHEVAILDADLNGPTQARMAGLQAVAPLPGPDGVSLPRSSDGVRVFSVGTVLPESESLQFESVSSGDSHTWRGTREFAALGEVLASVTWGRLDVLLFDLPPGAERTLQFAEFLGPDTGFLLVSLPSAVSRGVVARSIAALADRRNRILGYVENMSGYCCAKCGTTQPLFPEPSGAPLGPTCLGRVPFDPALASACDRGVPPSRIPESAATRAIGAVADRLLALLEAPR